LRAPNNQVELFSFYFNFIIYYSFLKVIHPRFAVDQIYVFPNARSYTAPYISRSGNKFQLIIIHHLAFHSHTCTFLVTKCLTPKLSSHRGANRVNVSIYCVIYISCLTRQLIAMYHLQVSSHRWQAYALTDALALPQLRIVLQLTLASIY
jgi:hypothetical protein